MYQCRRLVVLIELTVIMSAISLLYSLLSITTYSGRSVHSHRSLLSVDNESAVSRVDVTAAVLAIDQYSHYTTPLSSHAKDALGEMKFLQQRQTTTVAPRNVVNAIGKHSDQSGLTSLSAGVSDNRRLPAPVGRRLSRVVSRGRRPQSAAVVRPQISTDELIKSHTTLDCTMLLSNTSLSHVIPHVLHQTSDDVTVVKQVTNWMRSWSINNPSFDNWFWTDSAVRRLLDCYFPSWLVDLYDSYPLAINRADLRKYVLLYAVGGIVADLDVECLRPVGPLLAWLQSTRHGCIVGLEPQLHRQFLYHAASSQPYLTTAIIACRPRHPFVNFVLNLLPKYAANADKLAWNDNVLNSTGPTFLSDALRQYNSRHPGDVFVAPSHWFTPTHDPVHTAHFRTLCLLSGTRPHTDCHHVLHSRPHNDSYTTHHWLHSWADKFVSGPPFNVTRLNTITRLIT